MIEENMKTFHGDPQIKEKYLARVRAHRAADEIVKGQYWQEGKGCAVGCTIHSRQHDAYEKELGIPSELARLEDRIFEGLPNSKAKYFPEQFLEAIPVGVCLKNVGWKFCIFLLRENITRVAKLEISNDLKNQITDAILQVLAVHETAIESGEWDEGAAYSARAVARAAAEASWVAAAAEAAYAASAAANAAADAAAVAATETAIIARSDAYVRYKDELLRLLREAI